MASQENSVSERSDKAALLARIEGFTEYPLLILSLLMVPLLIGPLVYDMDSDTERIYLILDVSIWAVFAIDILVKLAVAPNRLAYARRSWTDILLVAVPWLRPLRILRVLMIGVRTYRHSAKLAKVDFLVIYALILVISAATAVGFLERGADSQFQTYHDALWWATVTITTVGYGDFAPISAGGRVVALFLMLGGVGIFGAITANLASFFIKSEGTDDGSIATLLEEVRELRRELNLR